VLKKLQALSRFVSFGTWRETRSRTARYQDRSERLSGDSLEELVIAIKAGKKSRPVRFLVFQQNRPIAVGQGNFNLTQVV
jgi:hypothetical protein